MVDGPNMRAISAMLRVVDGRVPLEGYGPTCVMTSPSPASTLFHIDSRYVALDLIRQGLCVFDGAKWLVLFNRRYAEMCDLDPSQLRTGMPRRLAEAVYAVSSGRPQKAIIPDRSSQWIATRVRRLLK